MAPSTARRVRRPRLIVALAVAAALLAFAALPRPHHAAPAHHRAAPPHAEPFLAAAERGYARAHLWWDPSRGWYREFLPRTHRNGLATIWGVVHLFGAADAIALADPTPAHVAAAKAFADGAERYWNPALRPVPGYAPRPGPPDPQRHTWYDDDAWWGVAFADAYQATGNRRYLRDAARALRFVDSGWDPRTGGIRWDDRKAFKASESLAGGTLTAAELYQATRNPHDLALARKYLRWANATIRGRDGLYGARSTPAGPMAYVEAPMAEALVRLCHATGAHADCTAGERLMRRTTKRFPVLRQPPPMAGIYLRSIVQLYLLDHDPRWRRIATRAAWGWHGRPHVANARPGRLQTHAATTSLLAWAALTSAR
jgi:hypothetical protein